jgi:arginyl-tRNA synthetase
MQSKVQSFFQAAIDAAFADIIAVTTAVEGPAGEQARAAFTASVAAASKPQMGDYQCTSAMTIARFVKTSVDIADADKPKSPVEVAKRIVAALPEAHKELLSSVTAAGPYINCRVADDVLVSAVRPVAETGVLAPPPFPKEHVMVDFSSPNIAKSMHVGHLRSTIIGDTICRLFEFVGCDVDRVNHVGDWGTQFGMLISHLRDMHPNFLTDCPDIEDLQGFYKEAKARFDADDEFKTRSRNTVVALQNGTDDCEERVAWRLLCDVSRREFQSIYDQLDVSLTEVGESFYQPLMPPLVARLEAEGVAREDDGALCVFNDGFSIPFMLRKTDGGFTYDTTDLAALTYRAVDCKADRLVYVVDNGQGLHFDQLFATAKTIGVLKPDAASPSGTRPIAQHVGFGLVCGDDGKKFRTRSGETVKLQDLLREAVEKAAAQLVERGREADMEPEELQAVAEAVGIGAVKYADLSCVRSKDYIFSFDRMLNFKGNTAVYMLYSYARIASMGKKAGRSAEEVREGARHMCISHPSERLLLLHLARFSDELLAVIDTLRPNRLCDYLYALSNLFTDFYSNCRVIVDDEAVSASRLAICEAVRVTIETCLGLLGIRTVDRM